MTVGTAPIKVCSVLAVVEGVVVAVASSSSIITMTAQPHAYLFEAWRPLKRPAVVKLQPSPSSLTAQGFQPGSELTH